MSSLNGGCYKLEMPTKSEDLFVVVMSFLSLLFLFILFLSDYLRPLIFHRIFWPDDR